MPKILIPADSAAVPRPRRWGRGLLIGGVLAILLALIALQLLDPWLRRTLEKQVAQQTHGQYRLEISGVHTSLWQGTIRLWGLRLRPAAVVADSLPRLRLDVARLNITGMSLWALLRKKQVPIDSVVLDSTRIEVLALARRPTKKAGKPLHERLPLKIPGLHIGYFGLLHTQAAYQPGTQPSGSFRQADLSAHDLLISPAGAADTQRVAYAAAWQLAMAQARAVAAHHHLTLGRLRFSTASRRVELDSLRIQQPAAGQGKPGAVRISLGIPRLVIAGLRAAQWQHQRHFQADSLLIDGPNLTFTPPAQPPPDLWKLLTPVARRTDLAHLAVRGGRLRVAGLAHNPSARVVNMTGTGLRIDSAARRAPGRIVYARAWTARIDGIAAAFDAPYYQASSAHLRLNTATRSLRLTGLALSPNLSPVQMNLRHGYQISQLSVRIPELTVAGLDFAALLHQGRVRATRVAVRRPLVRIAADGRGPINPHHSIITPEEMRKVDTRIDVRRLDLVAGNLYTRYRSPLSPVVGTISINRFSGTLRNVSNDPRRQTTATPLIGTATAYLQNRCRMTVNLAVPLLDPAGRHRVWGSFGPGPFAMLNSMTVPTRLVEFKKGNVQGIRFTLQGDKKQVVGTLTARYTGLQLELLSYKNGEIKQPLLKRVVSKVANVLVIRDQNPRKGGRVVSGDMTSKREPRFSVFVLWRQGVVSGLLNNFGLPRPLAHKISETQDVAPLPK